MKAKRQSQAQQKDAEHQAKLAALGKAKKDKEEAAAAERANLDLAEIFSPQRRGRAQSDQR